MTNLKIDGKEIKGEFIPFYNNSGFHFQKEDGELLTGFFKQGYSGRKEIELPITFDSRKNFQRTVNNSSRQVKDPYAYFLRINL